jgi:hypothetical protein
MGAVLLGIVEGGALLQVYSRSGQFAEVEQGQPKRMVSLEEQSRFLEALGEGEELFRQLPRGV